MIEAVVGNAVRFLDKINENLMKILNTLPRPVFARPAPPRTIQSRGRALRTISAYRTRPDMVTASVISRRERHAAGLQQPKFHHAPQIAVRTCLHRRSGSRLGFVGVEP